MQQLQSRAVLWVALAVFTASGFSGLIYQSIWSHYLKLFLGHAAYAQTLVLAIFMGGMAVGAWLASRLSVRWKKLLLAYAVVEAVIGVASLGFHQAFVAATGLAFDQVIPALGAAPAAVDLFKWSLASLLILPQSVLLGMTFPLMAGGLLRLHPERSGYALAMLYFTNSLGAAVGVLASSFYFIPTVGLPGTLAAAAIVNLTVAAAIMLVPAGAGARPAAAAAAPDTQRPMGGARLLLSVAAITGLSSFMYEVGWIRMLSLVLGSSTHAFELMLASFILGIAFGGLWVRRRIDSAASTERFLGIVQLAMGVAAVATLPVYAWTFEAMEFAMTSVAKTDNGYLIFNMVSQGLALAVMFPAAFFAGMTLPLITASLLRRGAGERAIGQVYAANTAGAIVGVALAVHVGFPYLGLKGLIVVAAAIDVALGIALLSAGGATSRRGFAWGAGAAATALVCVAGVLVQFDAAHLASGVFRTGRLESSGDFKVAEHIDGKTATVSVTRRGDVLSLRTNGKTDGSMHLGGEPMGDEVTMALSGALPLVFAPRARHVVNIGFGTGITTHVLLASPTIETVDTVEIEPAMVRAAEHFRALNARALDDPRSRLHFEDAKTYFASRQMRYDLIVSEPSNPWVSGVAGLFSTEFYSHVRRYLRDDGLLVQWVQGYEMTPTLFATILLALDESFSDYELWMANQGDFIIVAARNGRVPRPDAGALDNPRLQADLGRLGIRNLDDLLLHRIAGKEALESYFAAFGAQPNSDFFPVLDQQAPRARFVGASAREPMLLLQIGFPLLELFDRQTVVPDPAAFSPGPRPWLTRAAFAEQARAVAGFFRSGDARLLAPLSGSLAIDLILARAALVDCSISAPPGPLQEALANIAWGVNQHLPRKDREAFWKSANGSRCRIEPSVRAWLRMHRAVGALDAEEMAAAAGVILAGDADRLSPRQTADVLMARMAGLVLTGRSALAQREFVARRGRIADEPGIRAAFRLLVGRAGGAGPAP